jgi:SPP1 family predicted phage head-tail adaptor
MRDVRYKPLSAGTLNKRVQIQELTNTRDSHGGQTQTWNTLATRWASIEPLRGRELFEAQQVHERATVLIRMRPYSGLSAQHRLVHTE